MKEYKPVRQGKDNRHGTKSDNLPENTKSGKRAHTGAHLPTNTRGIDAGGIDDMIKAGDMEKLKKTTPGDLAAPLRDRVYAQAAADRLTKQAAQDIEAGGRSAAQLAADFVDTYTSKYTRATYGRSMRVFLDWCKERNINPLSLSHAQAVKYAQYQRESRAGTGGNTRINGVSAFYSFLIADGIIGVNPMHCIKRAPVERGEKKIPSKEEITAAIEKARRNGRASIADAILLLANTGLRVGALSSYRVIGDGTRYRVRTKGRDHVGYIPEACRHIDGTLWRNGKDIHKQIARYLGGGNSAHGLRHRYAIELYQASKFDIYRVSDALGHRDIAITTTYLKGLGAIQDNAASIQILEDITIGGGD